MQKHLMFALFTSAIAVVSCTDDDHGNPPNENAAAFREIGTLQLEGGATAAEISAYDPKTKKLFVINAVKSAIDVIDMSDPANLVDLHAPISVQAFGTGVNSIAVKNGLLAAAVEVTPKTNPGKVVIWNTRDMSVRAAVMVGSLPDMVTFSPDGNYILSANEGEPNEDYSIDPDGSVSIIEITKNFRVTTLDFSAFDTSSPATRAAGTLGYRVTGKPGTTLTADAEPEYIAVSADSKTAWVTLQENNAIAKVNIQAKTIERLFPLGFKNYNLAGNEIDVSDKDGGVNAARWPVYGMYMPDGIAAFSQGARSFVITANEGDSRIRPTSDEALPGHGEGDLYNEEVRVKDIILDPLKFPDAVTLQTDSKLGRLKITNTAGDVNHDGKYDALYSFGTRSFSIWDGSSGALVFDSGNKLEKFLLEKMPALYDDQRSDDKGVEPENVAVGKIAGHSFAFVGLERADAVVVVDVSNPASPNLLQVLQTGDAPEGILFIAAEDSPNGHSLLVTSCEGDGKINVFQPGRY
jgi:DNA-binding beta-propeller fold protein YncE